MKIKKEDNVIILTGKDKGKEGKVEHVFSRINKVLVSGVNIYKKHVKGRDGQKGGIYDVARPLDVSKIALVCPKCKKPTRVGYKLIAGEKTRICRKCGREINNKPKK